MDPVLPALIDFQMLLVTVLLEATGLGVAFIGLGTIVGHVAPVFGYSLKRLGLQIVGACLVLVASHAILLEVYGVAIPAHVLIAIYAIIALMLLQGLLNLLFGPTVGNAVVASLLGSLTVWIVYLIFQPLRLFLGLFR